MIKERIAAIPFAAATPESEAKWQVIHAGNELDPLSLAEMVEKADAGEIEADDLVKQAGGRWTKAREFAFLQEQFRLRSSRQEALDSLGRFHGIWLSKKALIVGGGALLSFVFLVSLWTIFSDAPPREPATSLKGLLGKSSESREIVAFRNKMRSAPEVCKFNDCSYFEWNERGLSFRFENDAVSAIFLFAEGADNFKQYLGELPEGLRFSDTRFNVEKRLGVPKESGGTDFNNLLQFWSDTRRDVEYKISEPSDDGVRPLWVSYPERGLELTYDTKELPGITGGRNRTVDCDRWKHAIDALRLAIYSPERHDESIPLQDRIADFANRHAQLGISAEELRANAARQFPGINADDLMKLFHRAQDREYKKYKIHHVTIVDRSR